MLLVLFTLGMFAILTRGAISLASWILFYLAIGWIVLSVTVHACIHLVLLARHKPFLSVLDMPNVVIMPFADVPSGQLLT